MLVSKQIDQNVWCLFVSVHSNRGENSTTGTSARGVLCIEGSNLGEQRRKIGRASSVVPFSRVYFELVVRVSVGDTSRSGTSRDTVHVPSFTEPKASRCDCA